MLEELNTAKYRGVTDQIQIIERLAADLSGHTLQMSKYIQSFGGSVLTIVVDDPSRLIQAALLTLVYADIGSTPDSEVRAAHLQALDGVSAALGVSEADLQLLVSHASAIRAILSGED